LGWGILALGVGATLILACQLERRGAREEERVWDLAGHSTWREALGEACETVLRRCSVSLQLDSQISKEGTVGM